MKLTIDDFKFIQKIIEMPKTKFSELDFPNLKLNQFKYKISKLNYLLKLTQKNFIYKRNCYYYIKNKEILIFLLKNLDFSQYNKAQRKNIIISKFISEDKINISKLMLEFSQSRTSIKKDLKDIEAILKEFQLSLKYKHNFGIYIYGKEKNLRIFLLNYIFKNSTSFFEENLTSKIDPIVFEFLKGKNSPFETSKILYIILYIQFFRIKNKHFIEKELLQTDILQLKKEEKKLLESFLGENLSDEYIYFSNFVTNLCYDSVSNYFDFFYSNFYILYDKFIENLEKEFNTPLAKDPILKKGLQQHLKISIYKLANKIPIYNPANNNSLNSLENIIIITKKSLTDFEKYFKINFSMDEVIFVSFHIKAALIRIEKMKKSKNILLVCNLGPAMTESLYNELNKNFILNIVNCVSYFQFKIYNLVDIDFIIHTVSELDSIIPNYQVSPILSEKNIKDLINLGFTLR